MAKSITVSQDTMLKLYGFSRTTLYRLMDTEGFPKPRMQGFRGRVWDKAEVDTWLSQRPALIKERGALVGGKD